ncbi:hypothetical protein DL766_003324 [Monosporascus sp. MC13-8B]|uniref:CN hydrolase domain-containing protein n=1 Tax=Monosporascus cannonballus TaxID=155416 RepID=A0ABY0H767_9PEZI|nr:hypothetical protein DL762_004831 [Monosporascus cannonballus]RYO93178.1 hypothetical protein DL763_004450 [Monosporascus cannonballus]RYP33695.1 hypothetical protein DL766_003324 [Monosporascus sp. MC13-8B]
MANIKIASVQFENASGDKEHSLSVIRRFSAQTAASGCQVVSLHECSITGYTFASKLSHTELLSIAEAASDAPIDGGGLLALYRKLHPFISAHLSPGNEYIAFDLLGRKAGILICYDNNVVENVRATALLGAEIVFMPHTRLACVLEFDGLKGRAWLMKWLPARAYENGVYVVFSNPIGMDHGQLKNGCAMMLDPFRDVVAGCRELGEEVAIAVCSKES